MDNIRCYAICDLGATFLLGTLASLRTQCFTKPFISKVTQYGNKHNQPHNQFNIRISVNPARRYMWCEFELDNTDVPEAQNFIDQQCSNRSIVQPTYLLRVQSLLLAEIVEAGVDIGLAGIVKILFACSVVGWGNRDTAIADSVIDMIT